MKMIRARRTRAEPPPSLLDDTCCASPKRKDSKLQSHLTTKQLTLKSVFGRETRNNSKEISSYFKKEKPKKSNDILCEQNYSSDDQNSLENLGNICVVNDFNDLTGKSQQPINFMGLIPINNKQTDNDCNIFLQEPVLSLNIDKTLNQSSSIIIKKSLDITPNFGSNTKINMLATNENTIITTPLDLSKPTQVTYIDSTTFSDSNSCDSGVVTDKSYDMSPRRRKPATPHRIVCPSPVKHINPIRDLLQQNKQQQSDDKKQIKSKKRLNVNQTENISKNNNLQQLNELNLFKKSSEKIINNNNNNNTTSANRGGVKENDTTTAAATSNKKLTEFFSLRRSVRKTKKEVQDEKNKSIEQAIIDRKEDDLEVRIFGEKGRGVVALRSFSRGEFVIEYVGELISSTEAQNREEMYAQDQNMGCYMYYFKHKNQQYCIDATAESGHLGRLVNHSRNGNLIPRTMMIKNNPRLVLFAKDDIQKGEEITYDYGDRSKESLIHHPWLAL